MRDTYTFTYDELYTLLNNTIGQFMQYMNGTNANEDDSQLQAVRDVLDALDAGAKGDIEGKS